MRKGNRREWKIGKRTASFLVPMCSGFLTFDVAPHNTPQGRISKLTKWVLHIRPLPSLTSPYFVTPLSVYQSWSLMEVKPQCLFEASCLIWCLNQGGTSLTRPGEVVIWSLRNRLTTGISSLLPIECSTPPKKNQIMLRCFFLCRHLIKVDYKGRPPNTYVTN